MSATHDGCSAGSAVYLREWSERRTQQRTAARRRCDGENEAGPLLKPALWRIAHVIPAVAEPVAGHCWEALGGHSHCGWKHGVLVASLALHSHSAGQAALCCAAV